MDSLPQIDSSSVQSQGNSEYITEVHRNYEPTNEDMFISVKSGDYQRMIWGHPQKLRDRETKHWEAFEKYIKDNGLEPLPESYLTETRMAYRFLQGVGWNYPAAHEAIHANKKYFDEKSALQREQFESFLQSGACYYSGRAQRGHQPVIVLNIKKFISQNKSIQELEDIACFYFRWIVDNMTVPGHIEGWLVILDLNDVGITELPIKQLKGFIKSLQGNFRGRMFRAIAVNSHWLLRGVWNAAWSWLDAFVQQKIILCGYSNCTENLLKYIDQNTLEKKFGGKKPDQVGPYFPPRV